MWRILWPEKSRKTKCPGVKRCGHASSGHVACGPGDGEVAVQSTNLETTCVTRVRQMAMAWQVCKGSVNQIVPHGISQQRVDHGAHWIEKRECLKRLNFYYYFPKKGMHVHNFKSKGLII